MNQNALEQWIGGLVQRCVDNAVAKFEERILETVKTMGGGATGGPAYLDMKRLGEKFGISRRAMRARLAGKGGKYGAISKMARMVNGKKMWLASDVDAYMRGGGK